MRVDINERGLHFEFDKETFAFASLLLPRDWSNNVGLLRLVIGSETRRALITTIINGRIEKYQLHGGACCSCWKSTAVVNRWKEMYVTGDFGGLCYITLSSSV